MAQPSVASYFNTRKRPAIDDCKVDRARKVLKLDDSSAEEVSLKGQKEASIASEQGAALLLLPNKIAQLKGAANEAPAAKKVARAPKPKEGGNGAKQISIERMFAASGGADGAAAVKKRQMGSSRMAELKAAINEKARKLREAEEKSNSLRKPVPTAVSQNGAVCMPKEVEMTSPVRAAREVIENERSRAPPSTPPRMNELDRIKRRLLLSPRLAELKASMGRTKDLAAQLKEAEKRTESLRTSPKLKTFKALELEVVSPRKVPESPEKAYLSPKKDSGVRRNLMNLLSPTKNAVALAPDSPSKTVLESTAQPALKLPYKYRFLAEMFRAIDTVSQIMHNRKETITFRKLKPAVEQLVKRNLTERHLGQIKGVFPAAFECAQAKLRDYGGTRQERWELVVTPILRDGLESMTSDFLLHRRRQFHNTLLDKVKDYHQEFLRALTPPVLAEKSKITRWHPEFDLEKVPDVDPVNIPHPPPEETLTSAREVLDRAKQMFQCNTRMEQAMAKLQATREANPPPPDLSAGSGTVDSLSSLRGIPKALLEKVRQRQAAKALMSMTRSSDKEKELQLLSRLPELARLSRNIFVTEKKNVLPLDTVLDKLEHSYRAFMKRADMDRHLRTLAEKAPAFLVFHKIRNAEYVKLAKHIDLSVVLHKLEEMVKSLSEPSQ